MKNIRRPLNSSTSQQRKRASVDKENDPPPKQPRMDDDGVDVPDDREESEDSDYQTHLAKLNKELRRQSPRTKKIGRLMKKTFAERWRWIRTDCPRVSEVLDVFPPLKKSKGVSLILKLLTLQCMCVFLLVDVLHIPLIVVSFNMPLPNFGIFVKYTIWVKYVYQVS